MKNLIILVLLTLISAPASQSQKIESDTTYYSNQQPYKITIYEGGVQVERIYFFRTGELMLTQNFDPRTGLQHGEEEWWWRNGNLMHACSYVYGDGHGFAVSYDWDGTMEKRELYVEGVSVPENEWGKYVRQERPLAER